MVFNWFQRKFSQKSEQPQEQQESVEEQEQEQEQEQEEQEEQEEQANTVAEDYLSWAKTAYKNIQAQQDGATTEPKPEEESSAPAAEPEQAKQAPAEQEPQTETAPTDTAPTDTAVSEQGDGTGETTAERVEPAAPEETISPTSEPIQADGIETEAPATPVSEQKVSETAREITETAPEITETAPEITETAPATPVSEQVTPAVSDSATVADLETSIASETQGIETAAPALAENAEAESTTAGIPLWARAEAERQERLKRLEETAVEAPVEEPLTTGKAAESETAVPGLAFDEEFLWSAEVLAAQGRRPDDISVEEITWLKKLRQGLGKTRRNLINQLRAIVGSGPLNRDAVMEIEAVLLQADVGIEATDYIIGALQDKLREEALPPKEAIAYLKTILRNILDEPTKSEETPILVPEKDRLNIWLLVGVNGSGKTTTIGKLARLAQKSGYKCTIAAADTFRAAAVEQVKVWGERAGVEVIANPGKNTDPAAVVFDAIAAAKARDTELLLVDTAGRLQNKKNLMDELSKVRRIINKKAPDALVEALIVLDATLGQNGLRQAQVFSEAVDLSGVILTKLDGTAKGGIALAVTQQLGKPIRFIGAGEGMEDLRPFSSYEFIEALLNG